MKHFILHVVGLNKDAVLICRLTFINVMILIIIELLNINTNLVRYFIITYMIFFIRNFQSHRHHNIGSIQIHHSNISTCHSHQTISNFIKFTSRSAGDALHTRNVAIKNRRIHFTWLLHNLTFLFFNRFTYVNDQCFFTIVNYLFIETTHINRDDKYVLFNCENEPLKIEL